MIKVNKLKYVLFLLSVIFIQQITKAQEKFTKVKELGGIQEYIYKPNGLKLLLAPDNTSPVVTVQIVYHVGSKHEATGNTGSTHLLEHLMFKGTKKFNKRKGTAIDAKLNRIGAQMNATTWNDRTNYYETIPSDKIEVALEIEADRMRNSLLLKEDKDAEMTVVRNEFERGENNPNQVLRKEMWSMAYTAHPYHHSTIGWRTDIENMPIEVLRNFYNTYYWPDNATLTIIGDFQKDNLFSLIDKYFGKITKSPHEIPQPYTEEPPQYGPRKVVIKKSGQRGVLSIGYKIPGRLHEDLPALTILGQILSYGPSSVLNKTYVDKGLAYYGFARPSNFQEVGLFSIGLGFSPTSNHEDLNKQLLETIEIIKNDGVQQNDVDRIVAKLKAQTVLSRDGSGRIAGQLTEAIAGGDWTDYIKGIKRLSKVTAKDVKRVANTYLIEDQSTTGYFIPKIPGSNNQTQPKVSNNIEQTRSKYYFRNPEHDYKINKSLAKTHKAISKTIPAYESVKLNEKGNKFTRKNIAGIDVITAKTGAKDFVTVRASLPISAYLNSNGNEVVPLLTVQMLSKGTTKNNKFQFSQKLEKLGVSLSVSAETHKINISFKCLKKDMTTVIDLLAEELRNPLFDVKEFNLLKDQISGNMKQGLANPSTQGSMALSQAIYPKGHPNYSTPIETSLEDIKRATISDLIQFHETFFGPKGMHLVAVGDVDNKMLYTAIKKAFHNWKGGALDRAKYKNPTKRKAQEKVVTIPQKPNAHMYIGQYTGLKRSDTDYLPFYIGNFTLGGGFGGRLMRTVRDEEGLTYNIISRHTGHIYSGGHWYINASFNPDLFQKGLDATMVQLKKWVEHGITTAELEAKKSNINGSFKVGMATTSGLANTILSFVERGLEPNYIDQFPKEIQAITLDQVNNAIKKYINLEKLVLIKSGSLDQNSKPLKE